MRQGVEAGEREGSGGTPLEGERSRQLRSLSLANFLSYGPEGTEFTFGALNVLVGPNGSGKTNLIEALRVMRSSTTGFGASMLGGGGIEAYLWRGRSDPRFASLRAVVDFSEDYGRFGQEITFGSLEGRADIASETIRRDVLFHGGLALPLFARYADGRIDVLARVPKDGQEPSSWPLRAIPVTYIRSDESGLERRRDHEAYPWLATIAEFYEDVAIYGEWTIGRSAPPRGGVSAGTRSDKLEENASNLANVMLELRRTAALPKLRAALRRLKATYEDFSVSPVGAQYQLYVEEEGVVGGINALRLSDGTLRFLALAAVLLHPKPPALVVIDEPEIGMHPDLIEAIAEMILEAAGRTQLIIATHSPDLLSFLRKGVDRLYAFGAGAEGTTVRGFDRTQLEAYLAEEPLGELWRQGDFGGNRF